MGKMFFAICFLACFVILANGKDIIKIGNETISEEDITPTKLVVDKVFDNSTIKVEYKLLIDIYQT